MSYYTEQEATRICFEVEKIKPLIEKYLTENLQKTMDKFDLTYGWIGNYNCGDEYFIDLEPTKNESYLEACDYFDNLLPENIRRFLNFIELEITIGEE